MAKPFASLFERIVRLGEDAPDQLRSDEDVSDFRGFLSLFLRARAEAASARLSDTVRALLAKRFTQAELSQLESLARFDFVLAWKALARSESDANAARMTSVATPLELAVRPILRELHSCCQLASTTQTQSLAPAHGQADSKSVHMSAPALAPTATALTLLTRIADEDVKSSNAQQRERELRERGATETVHVAHLPLAPPLATSCVTALACAQLLRAPSSSVVPMSPFPGLDELLRSWVIGLSGPAPTACVQLIYSLVCTDPHRSLDVIESLVALATSLCADIQRLAVRAEQIQAALSSHARATGTHGIHRSLGGSGGSVLSAGALSLARSKPPKPQQLQKPQQQQAHAELLRVRQRLQTLHKCLETIGSALCRLACLGLECARHIRRELLSHVHELCLSSPSMTSASATTTVIASSAGATSSLSASPASASSMRGHEWLAAVLLRVSIDATQDALSFFEALYCVPPAVTENKFDNDLAGLRDARSAQLVRAGLRKLIISTGVHSSASSSVSAVPAALATPPSSAAVRDWLLSELKLASSAADTTGTVPLVASVPISSLCSLRVYCGMCLLSGVELNERELQAILRLVPICAVVAPSVGLTHAASGIDVTSALAADTALCALALCISLALSYALASGGSDSGLHGSSPSSLLGHQHSSVGGRNMVDDDDDGVSVSSVRMAQLMDAFKALFLRDSISSNALLFAALCHAGELAAAFELVWDMARLRDTFTAASSAVVSRVRSPDAVLRAAQHAVVSVTSESWVVQRALDPRSLTLGSYTRVLRAVHCLLKSGVIARVFKLSCSDRAHEAGTPSSQQLACFDLSEALGAWLVQLVRLSGTFFARSEAAGSRMSLHHLDEVATQVRQVLERSAELCLSRISLLCSRSGGLDSHNSDSSNNNIHTSGVGCSAILLESTLRSLCDPHFQDNSNSQTLWPVFALDDPTRLALLVYYALYRNSAWLKRGGHHSTTEGTLPPAYSSKLLNDLPLSGLLSFLRASGRVPSCCRLWAALLPALMSLVLEQVPYVLSERSLGLEEETRAELERGFWHCPSFDLTVAAREDEVDASSEQLSRRIARSSKLPQLEIASRVFADAGTNNAPALELLQCFLQFSLHCVAAPHCVIQRRSLAPPRHRAAGISASGVATDSDVMLPSGGAAALPGRLGIVACGYLRLIWSSESQILPIALASENGALPQVLADIWHCWRALLGFRFAFDSVSVLSVCASVTAATTARTSPDSDSSTTSRLAASSDLVGHGENAELKIVPPRAQLSELSADEAEPLGRGTKRKLGVSATPLPSTAELSSAPPPETSHTRRKCNGMTAAEIQMLGQTLVRDPLELIKFIQPVLRCAPFLRLFLTIAHDVLRASRAFFSALRLELAERDAADAAAEAEAAEERQFAAASSLPDAYSSLSPPSTAEYGVDRKRPSRDESKLRHAPNAVLPVSSKPLTSDIDALVLSQESAFIQGLLIACAPHFSGDSSTSLPPACANAVFEFIHAHFLATPALIRALCLLTFPIATVRAVVHGVGSMHACVAHLPELLQRHDAPQAAQVFALELLSWLTIEYPMPTTLCLCESTLAELLNCRVVPRARWEVVCRGLAALLRTAKLFPKQLGVGVVRLLLRMRAEYESTSELAASTATPSSSACQQWAARLADDSHWQRLRALSVALESHPDRRDWSANKEQRFVEEVAAVLQAMRPPSPALTQSLSKNL